MLKYATLRLSVLALLSTAVVATAQGAPPHPVTEPAPDSTSAATTAAAPKPPTAVIQVDGQTITVTVKGKTVTLAPPIEMRAAVGLTPVVGYRSGGLPNATKCQAPDWHVPAVLDTFANCNAPDPVAALKCQSNFTARRAALCLAREGYRPLDQKGNPIWVYIPSKQKDNGGIFHYTADEVRAVTETDSDHDGVPNRTDKCPTIAGPAENEGCPYSDSDKDGLIDKDDKCPTLAGPIDNQGCPYGDRDKDGIIDRIDACPDVPGILSDDPKLNGCPAPKLEAPKASEPTPAPAAPATAPAAPKAEKKVFVTAAMQLGTDITKTTVGTFSAGLRLSVCGTSEALRNLWFFCGNAALSQATRWYPRGGETLHMGFDGTVSMLHGLRGLDASGRHPRDRMRANGVFAGPMAWFTLTNAFLTDQSFIANIGGGVGVELKAVMNWFTVGFEAGPGVCRTAKPGFTPSLLSQPSAEVCGLFKGYVGVNF